MTNQQRNKLAMLKAVLAFLNVASAITSVIPAFARGVARFSQIVADIDKRSTERNNVGAGTYDARDEAEEQLLDVLDETANALVAMASDDHLTDVREIAGIKRSKLERLPKIELVQRANAIVSLALQYAQKIPEYGMSSERLAELQPAIEGYKEAMEAVATGSSGRTGAVSSLKSLFVQADVVLKESLDRMAATLQNSHPQFYASYRSARVIHNMGGSRGKNGEQQAVQANTQSVAAK